MQMFGTLRGLVLLVGTSVCVYGNPVRLSNFSPAPESDCDGRCAGSVTTVGLLHATDVDSEHVSSPHGRPGGIASVTRTENGDGRSGPREAGVEAWSTSEMEDVTGQSLEAAPLLPVDPYGKKEDIPDEDDSIFSPTGEKKQLEEDGFLVTAPSQLSLTVSMSKDGGLEDQTKQPGFGDSLWDKEPETTLPSSPEPPNPGPPFQTLTFHSPIRPSAFASRRTSTPLSVWGQDGTIVSSLPDSLSPEMGPSLMPREDGPESLWTEAARPGGVTADTAVPQSEDEATEGTMSSEALPLIFEPFDDVTAEGAAPSEAVSIVPPEPIATGGMPVSEVDRDQPSLVTVETDSGGPSHAPPLLMPDWTSSWQTSGAELLEPISSSGPSVPQRRAGTQDNHHERDALRPTSGTPFSSFQHPMTTVTKATHHLVHKSRSGLEEMESEEEPDEDEDDENSEESVEDSDEDLTETPKMSSTQPPYSIIPPPPIWVQRNQGLMRSWVELIREKAGYVSGMLAPVGIGITGALLIVGALYSIRMIHRKHRNSFKHQRRKQPREPGTSLQDQAMLLADSSEDEF